MIKQKKEFLRFRILNALILRHTQKEEESTMLSNIFIKKRTSSLIKKRNDKRHTLRISLLPTTQITKREGSHLGLPKITLRKLENTSSFDKPISKLFSFFKYTLRRPAATLDLKRHIKYQ